MAKINMEIKKYLKILKLPCIRSSFQELAEKASKESLNYTEYLLELLQLEYENRNHKQ